MNYRRICVGLFVAACVIILSAFARFDDDPINRIISQLNKWLSANPQEKVYLHLDKPYYAIGDDIWFKAYVTVGSSHQLSAISGVLIVELINGQDSVKEIIKLPVINGLTWGDLQLPDTLKEGNYRLRAYTNWMRNDGPDYFFDEAITISNTITNDVFTQTTFSYGPSGVKQQVNADINYTNLDNAPYTNKPVSYEVRLGDKNIADGKAETDDKGSLHLEFINPDPAALTSGRIITYLKLSDKKKARKILLIKAASNNTDLQFFPEGGSFVNGNESKVAFKATGADGLGVDIRGVVTDGANKQVAVFSSSHLGMGVFSLKPESGKTYKAKVTYSDGSEKTVALPVATNEGYSLNIDNSDPDIVYVKILPGPAVSVSKAQNDMLSLVAQSGGTVFYAGKSKPGSKFFTADIPKNKFPTGIVQFTLFSTSGEPLNERLAFIQNHDQLKLDAITDQQAYTTRQKVRINMEARDKDGKPTQGSFSVAVTDETKVPVDENKESSILSNLLLTSDLMGYVEQPGYYFNNENDDTGANLDLLMLTQGYRRFEWKQVLNDTYPPAAFTPEKTLEISGHLKNLLGKPVANGKVTLFSSQGGIFMIDTVSDSKGNFVFKNLIFKDSVKFLVQARTAKNGKNIQVDIDGVQPALAAGFKNAPDFLVNLDNGRSQFLLNSKAQYDNDVKYGIVNRSIQLKEVVVKDTRIEPIKNSSNLNGPGNADQVLRSEDNIFSGCGDIADCLQGRISGVIFRNDTPFLMRSMHRPMQIVLDGMYVDGGVLTNVNPSDVASVEVLKNIEYTSIYGGRGDSGVLIVTTKTGKPDYSYQRYAPGVVNYMPKGYAKVREFYSPQYDNPRTNSQLPDLRTTIYWNPHVVTGKNGQASFEYFNADGKGNYRVVIEGIDGNGELGRKVFRYKVQ